MLQYKNRIDVIDLLICVLLPEAIFVYVEMINKIKVCLCVQCDVMLRSQSTYKHILF